MTDDDTFDRLCGLLPPQFETVLLRARVPAEFVSSSVAPQATRAGELMRWMEQATAHGERVRTALAKVLGLPAPSPPAPASAVPVRTVLFLAAEPTDVARLRVARELEEIRERLRVEARVGHVALEARGAVRARDLSQALLDVQPQIVHFAGHGTAAGRLVLESETGTLTDVAPEALEALFRLFPGIEAVVLNACYSDDQAEALARCVPHVVGMRGKITDRAAIAFSVGFYKALAAGRSVPEAHEFGCTELRLLDIAEHLTPVLMTRGVDAAPRPARGAPRVRRARK